MAGRFFTTSAIWDAPQESGEIKKTKMFTAVETDQGLVGIPGTEAFLSGIS